jgi:coenzyme F420-reducing hydrogenase delta subunit
LTAAHEPVIVGFLCNWCAYRAADLAGFARTAYSPSLHSIRLMCTGRVDAELLHKALLEGADGVLVVGCHPGECHYVDGNLRATRRLSLDRRLLAQLGVEPERVQLLWASAAEGKLIAATVDRMTAVLRALGPLQWRSSVLGPTLPARDRDAGERP